MKTLTVAPNIQVTAVSLAVPTATPTKKPAKAVRACRKLSSRATGHFIPVESKTTKSPVGGEERRGGEEGRRRGEKERGGEVKREEGIKEGGGRAHFNSPQPTNSPSTSNQTE